MASGATFGQDCFSLSERVPSCSDDYIVVIGLICPVSLMLKDFPLYFILKKFALNSFIFVHQNALNCFDTLV